MIPQLKLNNTNKQKEKILSNSCNQWPNINFNVDIFMKAKESRNPMVRYHDSGRNNSVDILYIWCQYTINTEEKMKDKSNDKRKIKTPL
jgi:hypothetical protein